jgi:EAL domain-containing protein (putative c-di-GMP-specific phosphodiesterase class I)/PAS domain-containing protein
MVPLRMRFRRLISRPSVRVFLSLASVAALGTLLTATIYWTLYDPRWIAFLGGILFAAVVATGSRLSRAEWLVARRTRQLERLRATLDREATRAHAATGAIQVGEDRMRLLCDSLPTPVFLIDREMRCHLHNTAAAMQVRLPHDAIDGRLFSATVGNEVFAAMQPHLDASLSGREACYELAWPGHPDGESFAVHHLPFPRHDPAPTGVFVILSRKLAAPAAIAPLEAATVDAAPATAAPAPAPFPEDASGDDIAYLRAMSDRAADWDEPRATLAQALKENRFLLMVQPIVALKPAPSDPACYEVLLRLQEEEDNLLPPGGFFPVAERYGMMEQLDRWVVRELITRCHEMRAMHGVGGRPALYCVNLSQASVRSHAFAQFVQKQLLDRNFDGGMLCFEIAEHEFALWHAEAARLIGMLKPFGCRFTADAFGSVKGSFASLKGLAFDFVKIDGVVVLNMLRHPAARLKVRAIAEVCRKSGMRSIAEFVEDQDTLASLRAVDVDYVQGFGVAQPERLGTTQRAITLADA